MNPKQFVKGKSQSKKPNTIRPDQKTPFVKCTAEQKEERVEFVAQLLVRQYRPSEIKRAVFAKFNIRFRQCADYLACARKLLTKTSQMAKEDAKSLGISVLLDVLRTGTPHDRIAAERRLSEIFGYNAPVKINPVGEDGTGPAEFIVHVSEGELPKAK